MRAGDKRAATENLRGCFIVYGENNLRGGGEIATTTLLPPGTSKGCRKIKSKNLMA